MLRHCHNMSGHTCHNGNGSHLSQCTRRAAYTVLTSMQEDVRTNLILSRLVCVLNLDISTTLTRLLSILVLHKDDMHMTNAATDSQLCHAEPTASSVMMPDVKQALYPPACLMSTE